MRRGLANPAADSQQIFRRIVDAMAHPGRVVTLPPPVELPVPLEAGTAAACLALLDFETPLWLDREAATADTIEYLRFHCGAPRAASPATASFAVLVDLEGMPSLEEFAGGTDEYPDRSATLIVQTRGLSTGSGRRLTGPGIDGETRLEAEGLTERFWAMFSKNHASFPRGVDVILTADRRIAALPRTTFSQA